MTNATTVEFTTHPEIVRLVIERQAGTLPKALMELAMNSIDAGATFLKLKLTIKGFTLIDDGRGFAGDNSGGTMTEEECIKEHFGKFGSPHQEGDATYGTFRVGRGQIMAFSRVTWRSGNYAMSVDIRKRGLSYEMVRLAKPVKGCIVEGEFYDQLYDFTLRHHLEEIKELFAYAPVPIEVNGVVVNTLPSAVQWDETTPDAFIKYTTSGGVKLYNLGFLVRNYPGHRHGNAIVVSRAHMVLNMARNDVQEAKCLTWKRIREVLAKRVEKRVRKGFFSEEDRAAIARQLLDGTAKLIDHEQTPVVTDITGKHVPLMRLENVQLLTVANRGDQMAETAMKRRMAYVLAQDTLDRFGVETVEEFVAAIRQAIREQQYRYHHLLAHVKCIQLEEVTAGLRSGYHILDPKELDVPERLMLNALNTICHRIAYAMQQTGIIGKRNARKVYAGISEVAHGWTNGSSYIAVERGVLSASVRDGYAGSQRLTMLILHELLHDSADQGSHIHGPDFYSNFHDILMSKLDSRSEGTCIHEMTKELLQAYQAELRKAGKAKKGSRATQDIELEEKVGFELEQND